MTQIFLSICVSLFIVSVHADSAEPSCDTYRIPESQTPGFTDLRNYHDQIINRSWPLQYGSITIQQDETINSVNLQWNHCNIHVKIVRYNTGKIYQNWKFGDYVVITFDIFNTGAVSQNWRLKYLWFTYERTNSGKVTAEGTATALDLAPYKNQIDAWCALNGRFVPDGCCVIYDEL